MRKDPTVMLPRELSSPVLPLHESNRPPFVYVNDSSVGQESQQSFQPKIYVVDSMPSIPSGSGRSPVHSIRELDDPDIDLTEGSVPVKVEVCNRQFYLNNFRKVC